ncbi:MAG: hypothetical protein AABW75_00305 [Nanoarchaeota archaeon]
MENNTQTNQEYRKANGAKAIRNYNNPYTRNSLPEVISSALNDTSHVISNQYSTYSPKTGRNYIIDD